MRNVGVIINDRIYKPTEITIEHGYDEFFEVNCRCVCTPNFECGSISCNIEKVIFNKNATIVLWDDNTKTVVRAIDEEFDPEKGLAMAISKKFLGNKGNYYNVFKEWVEDDGNNRK